MSNNECSHEMLAWANARGMFLSSMKHWNRTHRMRWKKERYVGKQGARCESEYRAIRVRFLGRHDR